MESRVAVLENKVETLEEGLSKHGGEDARQFKYIANMMEDLQARLSGIERTGTRFEADLIHRTTESTTMGKQLGEIFERLRTVERMIWLATGGVLAVGSIATFFGWNILKALGK